MATRIGVDIGGTFTDLVFFDDARGEVVMSKVPTVPGAPEDGAIAAVERALTATNLREARYFLHGTTVGLNALLERRGDIVVGLLATRGFRDVLEIRRGSRGARDPLFWQPPPPLVPRHLRLPVTERIDAAGQVYRALAEDDVVAALATFQAAGVTSIAIAFMNAYANPAHEARAAGILRAHGFTGGISLSHRISREYREYERTTTTVVDAFVSGRMKHYVRRLQARLQERAFAGDCLITRSGGGSMTFDEAELRPFETIMSGPVAGVEGAAELTRAGSYGDLVTADVGGTSFDTALVLNGRPELLFEGHIAGLPLQTPWVDVRSIGAGGGSIAHLDEGGLLRVGPRSAGANPGPACYGRGGSEPTVTDAALALGMLGTGRFDSGLVLDHARARDALGDLAQRMNRPPDALAQGIMRIAAAAMANAIRELTVERGIDPTALSVLVFGGAGPLMGTLLAGELGSPRVLVPPYAGNFSAWGLLGADITSTRARTHLLSLSAAGLAEATRQLAALFDALAQEAGHAFEIDGATREVTLDMRFLGQEHTLSLYLGPLAAFQALDATAIGQRFREEYARAFGDVLDVGIEIVTLRATLRQPLPRRHTPRAFAPGGPTPVPVTREAYSFQRDCWCDFALLDRAALAPGACVAGPAILSEATATTYLDAGFEARVDPLGSLVITRI
ncbi:MAG: hydantoinase/oxoprolinase family protein [Candidatus Binatia bacterium]